jgi:hypothetical protein
MEGDHGRPSRPTMESPQLGAITGNWELDEIIMSIARIAKRVMETRQPAYEEYRTRRQEDDS